jgi:SAM-dependent methyltransferase
MNERSSQIKETIRYYDEHVDAYCASTSNLDMVNLYSRFLPHIPIGGRILDAGCGSGRDSKAFLDRGYKVVSIDASEMMVEKTANLTGQPARCMRFDELPFVAEFDGIWTCASLLHVPRQDTKTVWSILFRAMKPGAVSYMSFKEGLQEEIRNGRLFNDQTESSVRATAGVFSELVIIDVWSTADVRPGRQAETWVNALLTKSGVPYRDLRRPLLHL